MSAQGPAVLLVDDREENLIALRAVLEALPCRLVSAGSGREALKALLQEDFAVVLLDVQMPGMDGFETAELIKARQRTSTVPIIFVTAISKERHHVFRGYSAGAVDYVFKPYDPMVLRSKVAVFLELDAKSRAAARSEAILRAAFHAAPIGMARLDLDGRVAEANRALAALLGHPAVSLRDRLFDDLIHPEDVPAEQEGEHEARLLTAGGEEVPCALSFSLARPGDGLPDTIVAQVQDLRERRRAEEERTRREREHAARAEAERTSARLQAIQRISDAALGTLAFDDLVRELLGRMVEALAVDTAAVLLHEAGGVVIHEAGKTAEPVKRHADRDAAEGSLPWLLGDAVASSLEAPLIVDGEDIGALHVGTLFGRSFTDDDRALLRLAADRAAIGIQRARLFQRERRIAEELQRSLLPSKLPNVPGLAVAARYQAAGPGSQVGGDWYDSVVAPDGRVLLIVGDVAGRGIPAASTMGQLRSALRAYTLVGHSPARLLERLNAFHMGLPSGGMTTVALVSVHPATGEVRYAKAGHPPALLLDAEGRASWLDEAHGIPLGAMEATTFTEGTATLSPGSTLVLYTDGLVELRGEPLDRGFERLAGAAAGAIAAPGSIDDLCEAILTGTLANPAADDDVTLLVLRTAGAWDRPAADAFPRRRPDLGARELGAGTWPHARVREAFVELPAGPGASAEARRVVADTLGGAASRPELDDLLIVVTELVNNAVVHGEDGAPVSLRIAAAPEALRVEVASRGEDFALRAPSPLEEPGGVGLLLVDRLSSRWGVDGGEDLCAWLEIDRPAPPPVTDGAGAAGSG